MLPTDADPGLRLAPGYHQVRAALRRRLAGGEWQAGERIPPEPLLMKEFGVRRGTVRQAVDTLVRHGLLQRQQGRGTFVRRSAASPGVGDFVHFLEDLHQRGFAIVVLALVWTARATGERRYVEAASRYVDYTYRHRLDPARFGRATKFGYAMLPLYADTGDPQLLAHARHLGDVLVTHQSENGLWEPRPVTGDPSAPYERLAASADCACTIFALAGLS